MTVPCPLNRRDILDPCCNQFGVGDINIVDPEPGDRTGIKMIMFNRLRPEDLEQVSVRRAQSGEPAHIKCAFHAEDIGKEVGCLPAFVCRRASPDDSFDAHIGLLTGIRGHYGNRRESADRSARGCSNRYRREDPSAGDSQSLAGKHRLRPGGNVAIESIEDLRDHLLLATRVELSTVPIYLSAMYSIKDQESDAAQLIRSVVVEEMLHVCLVTNLLLSIGGEPDFGYASIPTYPGLMAHHKPDLLLELRRCTIELIRDVFMAIESPRAHDAPNEDDEYETLGQFYGALEEALDRLDDDLENTVFANHQPERQLSDPSFYAPVRFDAEDSGGLLLVSDRASADRALEIIIDQGEGLSDHRWADPAHEELTHYYKFKQIADGEAPLGEVWPVLDNPRTGDLPPSLQMVSDLFNAMYGLVFVTMSELFSGTHNQGEGVGRLYALMSSCLAPTARYLVSTPISADNTAAPTFEVFPFSDEPWAQTVELADTVSGAHPELDSVARMLASIKPPA